MSDRPSLEHEKQVASEARAYYADYFARRVGVRGRDVAEDLVQEASIGLLRALRGSPAQNPEGLRGVIGQRTWFGYLRREYRSKKIWDESDVEDAEVPARSGSDPLASLDDADPAERLRFQVAEFYRARNSDCLELALLYFRGMDWIEVAKQTGAGYAAVRQRWSRCLKLLRDAVTASDDLRDSLWGFWSSEDV